MRPSFFLSLPLLGILFSSYTVAAPSEFTKPVITVTKLPNGITMKVNANKTEFTQNSKSDTIDLTNAPSTYFCSGLAGYGPIDQDCYNIIAYTFYSNNLVTFEPEIITSYTSTVSGTCAIDVYNYSVDIVVITASRIGSLANFLVPTCDNVQGFASGTVWFNDFDDAEIDVRHA